MGRASAPGRLPFLPALDGIRALAVVAVLLYHADLPWLPGGFLGVEVFFVLSGYLITALLWSELRTDGRISLSRFWHRRARRLLPAVVALLTVVSLAFVVGWPAEVARIRGDIAAALGYVSNWFLIGGDRSYFSQLGRPSPFQHLWSLAIEEQFYLVWPVVLWGLARMFRTARRVAGAVLGLAAASTIAMWVLYAAADPSRAYFGTDTRAAGLLVGAALAILWRPFERPRPVRTEALDAVLIASTGYLVWAFLRYDASSPFTFRPGLQLVALATAALIATSVHPAARASRVLGWAPARWLGRRSYGIYLWHWPVFVVLRPDVDLAVGPVPALVPRLALTLVLAELSFRYVEEPIRSGAIGRIAERVVLRAMTVPRATRVAVAGWSTIGATAVLGLAILGTAVIRAPAAPASSLAREQVTRAIIVPMPARSVGEQVHAEAVPRSIPSPRAVRRSSSLRGGTRADTISPLPPLRADIVSVGDSVMLGARAAMARQIRGIYLDAAVARQADDGIGVLRELRRDRRLTDTVVVHLGNNGMFTAAQFDEMMRVLRDADRVIVVNVKVPRRWEGAVNAVIASGVHRHDRAVLVDWHRRWRDCPGGVFESDGYHVTSAGAVCYSALIADAVESRSTTKAASAA